jgi:hypothetical protein
MRLSKSGAFVGGILCAVVVGTGTAVAATRAGLIGGTGNAEKTTTVLTDSKGTPLSLVAKKGTPALKVSNTVKVKNLDSDLLDGKDSGAFLPTTGTAKDSAKLGGQPPSAFLPSTGTAADSAKLGGQPPSAFLPATGTASDSSKLGGLNPSSYATTVYGAETAGSDDIKVKTSGTLDTFSMPPGTYLVQFTATLTNPYQAPADFDCNVEERLGVGDNDIDIVGIGGASANAAAAMNQTLANVTINQVVAPTVGAQLFAECSSDSGDATGIAAIAFSTLTATRIQSYVGSVPPLGPAA